MGENKIGVGAYLYMHAQYKPFRRSKTSLAPVKPNLVQAFIVAVVTAD